MFDAPIASLGCLTLIFRLRLTYGLASVYGLTLIYVLLLLLLLSPIVRFLRFGWRRRRKDILREFSPEAAEYYLTVVQRQELPGDPGKALKAFYNEQSSRMFYYWPLALLLFLAGTMLLLCLFSGLEWVISKDLSQGPIPMEVVLAILGAYMWVLFDHFKRSLCDNLSSGDLYWGSFRFVIAVPAAYALAAVFAPQIGRPLAFLIGALPTGTLMTAMWRFSASKLQLTDAPGKNQTTLQDLLSVDTYAAERFAAEDITTPLQLAYADPVRLTIRTGLGFGYVLGCTGEALVWVYFKESLKIVRRFGLVGSYECRSLWEKLKDEDNVIQQKNAKAIVKALARKIKLIQQKNAKAIVKALAREIKLPEEAVLGLLEQVAEDPYTELQWKCWGPGPAAESPAGKPAANC